MLFAASDDNTVFNVMALLALFAFGARWWARKIGEGYRKFDKDGTVHAAAKAGVTGWIKRFFGL